jgi:hypothetical protein
MNITRSDSHIPSAPAASMNQFQIPKGQNPLRLPFASFRLIFGLEKTAIAMHLLGRRITAVRFIDPALKYCYAAA